MPLQLYPLVYTMLQIEKRQRFISPMFNIIYDQLLIKNVY